MDHFFIEIYESVIYKWLVLNKEAYSRRGIHFSIDEKDAHRLLFECQNLKGEIYFWNMHHIIEETIVDNKGNITFYLHFRIVNMASTHKFIQDFLNQMISVQETKHIGMSCSCGITSSLFVEKIQKLSQMLNLPYLFDVVPISEIENVYKDYDMIILAPQTSYLEPRMKAICQSDCCIMSMDASIFATSHYQQALSVIQEKLS